MEATPLTLHQMIIHKVDHQKFDVPRLADVESPITPEAESFLLRQIRENREHKYTRTARFKAVDPNQVCLEKLQRPFADETGFVLSRGPLLKISLRP